MREFIIIEEKSIRVEAIDAYYDDRAPNAKAAKLNGGIKVEACLVIILRSGFVLNFFNTNVDEISDKLIDFHEKRLQEASDYV